MPDPVCEQRPHVSAAPTGFEGSGAVFAVVVVLVILVTLLLAFL